MAVGNRSIRRFSSITAFASAFVFSLFYVVPVFHSAENRIYDLFLRLRSNRPRIDNVVFLDVDDQAVAHIGVFPWPRSVMADALLRLKEYGAEAAIFDIEYIDKSPTEVDEVYLRRGLPADFDRRFQEIGITMAELLNAVGAGYIKGEEAPEYIDSITDIIAAVRDGLYRDTIRITRDNDEYLAQSSALFGKTWATLNLQDEFELTGEQAERRSLAEERFSYPVQTDGTVTGGNNVDILAAIPSFMESAAGAGFTNIAIDRDGVRRRIFLTRNVKGHWYLQLAFAPLVAKLGNPDITLGNRKLIIRGATLPGKTVAADIVIPLDDDGAMLLDWPKERYHESYSHVSFARFSLLEEYQAHIEEYLSNLTYTTRGFFPAVAPEAGSILALFEEAAEEKARALAERSDSAFARSLALRDEGISRLRDFLESEPEYIETPVKALTEDAGSDAALAASLEEEYRYCQTLFEYTATELQALEETAAYLAETLAGKMCILGRVDTGTTDIGVNPFYGDYVNVGTHAVALDTVLSQSFITPLPALWSVALAFLLIPALVAGSAGFKPGLRIMLGTGGILLIPIFSFLLFAAGGLYLGTLGPALAMTFALLVRETVSFVGTNREKLFLHSAFSRYLSPQVISEIIADPSKLNLGGEKREMTAIFTDIQGFSTISEKLDPVELVRLLNRYLTKMSNIIMENLGTVDKYEGDAIIAFFGAPVHREDHAALACRSALSMKKAEQELNAIIAEEKLSPSPLFTRIGINTGDMVVGNMGAENKMDYTIMGNAVNLAARLEGVNKQYHTGGILVSEYTHDRAGGEFMYRRLDRVRVVGINTPVRLYELLDLRADMDAEKTADISAWEKAIDLFEGGDFEKAEEAFTFLMKKKPDDHTAKLYADRCMKYLQSPPEEGWDGVFNLTEK
ncbi:MAG: adenylate/guanylate cyclase domain-containing protein [Treponema sp.]|jgi:adenylate cyclase|nr:adenylate/guanylate cyclase domain-containing protein [Treponema sp.]